MEVKPSITQEDSNTKRVFKNRTYTCNFMGDISEKVFIAIHGNMSNKEDDTIVIFAEQAIKLGYQVISFDLPEHGERDKEDIPCKIQVCVKKLALVMLYGSKDNLCEAEFVFEFVERFKCNIVVMDEGEHYFHTQEQLKFFEQWLSNSIY